MNLTYGRQLNYIRHTVEFGGSISRQNLIRKVEDFGETPLPLTSPGFAMMFLFTKHASSIMKIEKDDDNITEVTNIAKMINREKGNSI